MVLLVSLRTQSVQKNNILSYLSYHWIYYGNNSTNDNKKEKKKKRTALFLALNLSEETETKICDDKLLFVVNKEG